MIFKSKILIYEYDLNKLFVKTISATKKAGKTPASSYYLNFKIKQLLFLIPQPLFFQ